MSWTDGWLSVAGHSEQGFEVPPLARCAHCGVPRFRSDFERLGALVVPRYRCRLDVLDVGPSRVAVMKLIREISNRSLAETKAFVERLPAPLVTDRLPEEALEFQNKLERLGATTTLTRQVEGESSPATWVDAPFLGVVDDPADVLGFIETTRDLSQEREAVLRTFLVQLWNHPFRDQGAEWVPLLDRSPDQIENFRWLLDVPDGGEPQKLILKGEIAREMGDFGAARAYLSFDGSDRAPSREFLLDLVREGKSSLCVQAIRA